MNDDNNDPGAMGLVALGLFLCGVALLLKGFNPWWWTGCFAASAVAVIWWARS